MAFPPIQFDNPFGWYAFSGLAALVLMYMIRPKMIDVKIPSLMFLMKQKGTREKSTFLKKFTTNVLFFLQFLLIALLAAAALSPLITTTYDSTAENTVLVLDVSASMQAKDDSQTTTAQTRFDKALAAAKKYVRGTTSIILAEGVPLIVLDKGSESKAQEILSHLKPKETGTNLGDAMILANDLIGGTGQSQLDGRVIVISDFIWTEGADPEVIKTMLESRGLVVDFINVAEGAGKQTGRGNIGFVSLDVGNVETTLGVKNYFDKDKDVVVEVTNEDSQNNPSKLFQKRILAKSLESISFPTMGGITIAKLKNAAGSDALSGDAVEADNYLFISNPKKGGIKVLILSNKPSKFLKTAFEASGSVIVTEAEPPVIPRITPEAYDIVVFNQVNPSKILTGTVDDLRTFVQSGKSFIALYQEDLGMLKLGELLPVTLKESFGESPVAKAVENQFTKDVGFGSVKKHYSAEADNATIVFATATTSGSPLIALKNYVPDGRSGAGTASSASSSGKIMYYGIDDLDSDFKNAPSYPIFWNGVLNFMVGIESLSNFNHKTGKVFAFDSELSIQTPHATITTSKLVIDNAGIYVVTDAKHAANLVDEKESDVYQTVDFSTTRAEQYTPKKVVKEKQVSLELYLLIAAIAFLVLELLYSKYRGDF